MAEKLQSCLQRYVPIVKQIYGDTLSRIVLFGSHARGDYNKHSDVDVMLFLNVPPQDERLKINALLDATFDFNMANNVDIQPIPKSNATFRKWAGVLPFYQAINREGVVIYG